jgi:penicillin-binding protein 1A
MARTEALPEALARRAQQAPIVRAPRGKLKTEAPAVVENVFDELKASARAGVSVEALVQGRIRVRTTVDNRLQRLVNVALEAGLADYEKRHPRAKGQIQGSVVVLANGDGRILAEAGGRQVYRDRYASYSDYNRVTDSRRQPGSVMKPIVYLTAFRHGTRLDTTVLDEPIAVETGWNQPPKWIRNYDDTFKGAIPARLALAESRNAATIHIARDLGIDEVIKTARELGIGTPLQPYITTALGASEVRLLEIANAYRALASGVSTDPFVIDRIADSSGRVLYTPPRARRRLNIDGGAVRAIQEGLRGVVRLPSGTAHALDAEGFGIPVMGKTGTSSDFRDALFVGSTYGAGGITVAVRVGFDDNRELGQRETGGRAALPIFRDVVRGAYEQALVGPAPAFPEDMEQAITAYLASSAEEPSWADGEAEVGPVTLPALQVGALGPPAVGPASLLLAQPPALARGVRDGRPGRE